MTIRHRFISGLKWSAFGKAMSQIVSWAITIVVMRLLTPGDYGLMAIATMVVGFLAYANEFGLGAALVQAREIDDERCGAVFGAMLLLAGGMAALLALASPLLARFFDEPALAPILAVSGCAFVLTAMATIPESILRREMDFKALAGADLALALGSSLITLLLAYRGFGVWSLVVGNLLGTGLRTLLLHRLCPRRIRPHLRLRQCRDFLGFGGYLTASRFAWWFMSQADILIGAKLLGKEALGLYSVSLHLASLPMQKAMGIINQVAFSAVARVQEEKEAARRGLAEGLRWLGYCVFPALAGMALTAPLFVPLLLGKAWAGAILPLQLVALAIPLRMIGAILSTATTALGRADIDFRNTLTGCLILPASFLIGAQWGPVGLAAAWLAAVPVVFALNFRRSSALIGIGAGDLLHLLAPSFLATALMAGGVLTAQHLLAGRLAALPLLLTLIASGALLYPLILYAIDAELRRRLRGLWSKP